MPYNSFVFANHEWCYFRQEHFKDIWFLSIYSESGQPLKTPGIAIGRKGGRKEEEGRKKGRKDRILAKQCIANIETQILNIGKRLVQVLAQHIGLSGNPCKGLSKSWSPHDFHASSILHHLIVSNLPSKGFTFFLGSKPFQEVLDTYIYILFPVLWFWWINIFVHGWFYEGGCSSGTVLFA